MSPDHVKEERYEQLCALAAIGELSAAEFAELSQHLADCTDCRELYSDFRRIASNDLGAVAAGRRVGDNAPDLDEPALLCGVLERAQAETSFTVKAPDIAVTNPPRSARWLVVLGSGLRSPILATASLTILIGAALGLGAYRYQEERLSQATGQLNSKLIARESEVRTAVAQANSSSAELLQRRQLEQAALERSLADTRKDYANALQQGAILKTQLAVAQEQVQKKNDELQQANASSQRADSSVKDLEARLQTALGESQSQTKVLEQLQRKLRQAEQDAAVSPDRSGVQDADAREVFGARDLHIVDVYDVDGSGKTKRSFGRVYFVEKKLLLFYAFDLQDKQRQRVAAAFQAWGYRQGNEGQPQNLGLFLMDDPAASRWILKVNDTRVLQRIDAVFVTLEPPNGSPSPRGRKLLYANLGGPPNHP